MVGAHRRVKAADLLAYQQRDEAERKKVLDELPAEAEKHGLKPTYHVYARLNLYQTDNVRFYQIPDRILADFGLDVRSEPFLEDDQ